MQYGMIIELDKCIGCQACVTACKERWDTGPGASRDWVMEFEHGRRGHDLGITFYPGMCNHCDEHACTSACPTGATYKNEQGIVVVDADVCIGCGNCISLCPYGARHADARKGIVEKCNFCAPYVARGQQPACVESCLADCRHFGDLDEPDGAVANLIEERDAQPLFDAETNIGANVYYAPPADRARVIEADVMHALDPTTLSRVWDGYTRPVARYAVPAVAVASVAGGLLANVIARRQLLRHQPEASSEGGEGKAPTSSEDGEEHAPTSSEDGEEDQASASSEVGKEDQAAVSSEVDEEDQAAPTSDERLPAALPRHRFGMRFLHWFNVTSWLGLVLTGTALMVAPSFALFGSGNARAVSSFVGGQANLLMLHVLWGALWALVIVPAFLYFKRGGLSALAEIRFTRDDLRWMMRKPLVMIGRLGHDALPPQDKYNAGQKAFAASALVGTTVIIISGVIMAFHLGSPEVIRAAILAHKLAVLLALVGLAVHITMAAVIADERPALASMVNGKVDKHHAAEHSSKWVEKLRRRERRRALLEDES